MNMTTYNDQDPASPPIKEAEVNKYLSVMIGNPLCLYGSYDSNIYVF